MDRRPVIAVVGSSVPSELDNANAREVGRLVAEHGWVLITGGRDAGVMNAASEGAKELEGSLTIGILPNQKTEASPAVDVAIVTDTGEARNNIIVLTADVVIACGVDDPGTASEIALALKNGKTVILLGAAAAAKTFFKHIGGGRLHLVESPADAITLVATLNK